LRYRSDESREKIYEIELTDENGNVKTYLPPDLPEGESEREGGWRVMDCVDCHNRPSHVFRLPDQEVDRAINDGQISRSLPFVRREGIRVLRGEYASREEAGREIDAQIEAFYRENYPEVLEHKADLVAQARQSLKTIYDANVFPKMKLNWGNYPVHIGHTVTDGCFRCHDDERKTAEGDVISQDCFTCHAVLAIEEENPEILATLEEE